MEYESQNYNLIQTQFNVLFNFWLTSVNIFIIVMAPLLQSVIVLLSSVTS